MKPFAALILFLAGSPALAPGQRVQMNLELGASYVFFNRLGQEHVTYLHGCIIDTQGFFGSEYSYDIVYRGRPSFSLAVMADIPTRFGVVLQTGLRYAGLGRRSVVEHEPRSTASNSAAVPTTYSYTLRQHVLSVPVRLRYDLGTSPAYLLAGPEVGVLLSAQQAWHRSWRTGRPAYEATHGRVNVTSRAKRWNAAMTLGAGYRFRIAGYPFYLQFLYAHGVVGTMDGAEETSRTREVALSVGYSF